MTTRLILLMGVSGSGTTTVSTSLARFPGWDFYDADDFHLPAARPGVLDCSSVKE